MKTLVLLILLGGCGKEPEFSGAPFDPPEPAPELILQRHDGPPFDLSALKGNVVLLFFGYTHCPDVCPTTLAQWSRVYRELGADTLRVRFVFVSLDPERDSPETATKYAKIFHPAFIGLSTDSATLGQIADQFHVSAFRDISPEVRDDTTGTVTEGDNYTISHSSQTFVVDRKGNLRLVEKYGAPVEDILKDVKALLE